MPIRTSIWLSSRRSPVGSRAARYGNILSVLVKSSFRLSHMAGRNHPVLLFLPIQAYVFPCRLRSSHITMSPAKYFPPKLPGALIFRRLPVFPSNIPGALSFVAALLPTLDASTWPLISGLGSKLVGSFSTAFSNRPILHCAFVRFSFSSHVSCSGPPPFHRTLHRTLAVFMLSELSAPWVRMLLTS